MDFVGYLRARLAEAIDEALTASDTSKNPRHLLESFSGRTCDVREGAVLRAAESPARGLRRAVGRRPARGVQPGNTARWHLASVARNAFRSPPVRRAICFPTAWRGWARCEEEPKRHRGPGPNRCVNDEAESYIPVYQGIARTTGTDDFLIACGAAQV